KDELAAESRINDPQRRDEDDEPEDLRALETKRLPGLDLSAGNGLDAGAEDLGSVGGEVDRHAEHRSLPGRQPDADRGKGEVDDEELNQKRRVADDLDIGSDQPL